MPRDMEWHHTVEGQKLGDSDDPIVKGHWGPVGHMLCQTFYGQPLTGEALDNHVHGSRS